MDPNTLALSYILSQPFFLQQMAAAVAMNPQLLSLQTPNNNSVSPLTPPSGSSTSANDTSPDAETPSTSRNRKRTRTIYTQQQVDLLEAAFGEDNHLNAESRNRLADVTGLDVLQVNKWFQNRRSKKRKQSVPSADVAKVPEVSNEVEEKSETDESDRRPPERTT